MKPVLIYTTVPSAEMGAAIAHALLEAKLIACANLLPPHVSFYRWQGKMETAQEQVLLLKAHTQVEAKIYQEIKILHPYDCPAIFTLPVQAMDAEFEKWLIAEIQG